MTVSIHTSDRINFKRCRRRWNWTSPVRQNLTSKTESVIHLWFGSAFHFALEDYHGHNKYGSPQKALFAYYNAFEKGRLPMPEEADDYITLGTKMLDHYLDWLKNSPIGTLETVYIDGEPQVESKHQIEIEPDVVYDMTFDRVARDEYGRYWLVDYKTAAQFDTNKLETDPQVTSYLLFADSIYDVEFEGMIYLQFKKDHPKPPKVLQSGELSMNKSQSTTPALYLKALLEIYGDINRIPKKYAEFLQSLKEVEAAEGDKFIKHSFVRRSEHARLEEWKKIQMEVKDMLNPELPLYPNPTRDCFWDCSVRTACIMMDEGGDWEHLLLENFIPKPEPKQNTSWRNHLPEPIKSGEDC